MSQDVKSELILASISVLSIVWYQVLSENRWQCLLIAQSGP